MFDKKELTELREARARWEAGSRKEALERSGEREMCSDLPKKRLYTPEDLNRFDYLKDADMRDIPTEHA